MLPTYGRKAAQFVDLLGYFSLRFSEASESPEQVSLFETYEGSLGNNAIFLRTV